MKKPINEIKKMQRLAGLITESEYQESQISEDRDKKIISILRKWDAEPGDRLDYQTVANMIEVGRYTAAAKFITDELDTSISEMMMEIIEENDPELYKKMFGRDANASKFAQSDEIDTYAAAWRVSKGEDYDKLAKQFSNLQNPKVKASVMRQAAQLKKEQ
jgi:hypothetical protein